MYDCASCEIFFIYGVLTTQDQAIGRNLHGVLKILAKDKKGGSIKSIPDRGCNFS